jgi:hypothetical protein
MAYEESTVETPTDALRPSERPSNVMSV